MSDINDVVKAQHPRDVILFITSNHPLISYPALDRLYARNDWINIADNLALLNLVHAMAQEGLIEHSGGGLRKGPNWKAPAFMSAKT